MIEEAYPEAAAILRDAGWTPHPERGVYTVGTFVMGGLGGSFHVKDYAAIQPGHPLYSADTPDTAEEAAAWLVERFKAPEPEANPLSLESLEFRVAQEQEPEQSLEDESNGETGEAFASGGVQDGDELGTGDELSVRLPARLGELDGGTAESVVEDCDADANSERAEPDLIDADFEAIDQLGSEDDLLADEDFDPPALEGGDVEGPPAAEYGPTEAAQDRFIGLDDLDRRRSLRIGDTMRYANSLMPPWSDEELSRLISLRNFALGVSEGRWNADPAQSAELNALETTLRRINDIKEARDQKVAFLEATDRPGVEGFVIEADWP